MSWAAIAAVSLWLLLIFGSLLSAAHINPDSPPD